MADLCTAIKKLSTAAVEAASPVEIFIGKIKSMEPVTIEITPELIINQSNLVLSRSLEKLEIEIQIGKHTEEAMDGDHKHAHWFIFSKTYTIRKGLKANDMVILIRQKGGQMFVVMDAFGGSGLGGSWL